MASSLPGAGRGRVVCVALGLAFPVLLFLTYWGWQGYRLPVRVQAALPARPDVSRHPPILAERLAAAEERVGRRGETLAAAAELGRLYHANGYEAAAEACWNVLRREQSEEGRWSYYLADLRRAQSDAAGQRAALEETVARAPAYAPAWLMLGRLAFKSGDLNAAENAFRRRLQNLPNDPVARLELARVALQRGQRDGARTQLTELVEAAPTYGPAHDVLAEVLTDAGQIQQAHHHRQLRRSLPEIVEVEDPWLRELEEACFDVGRLVLLGTVALQRDQPERARTLLERAVAVAPDDPHPHQLLGEYWLKHGELEKAREVFERGLSQAQQPASILYYVNMSEAYRLLGRLDDALAIVDRGFAAVGEAYELYHQRGVVLSARGDTSAAMAAYRSALARAPRDTQTNFELGLLLAAAGRRDEAEEHLQRSLLLKPTFPKALIVLARLKLQQGDLAAAETYVRPLYEAHGSEPIAQELYAQWHLRAGRAAADRGDTATAARLYEAGLTARPDDPELNVSLGLHHLLQGRAAEALPRLQAYQRVSPENAQAAMFLGQAYAQLGYIVEARQMLTLGESLAREAGQTTTANHCREILRQLPAR